MRKNERSLSKELERARQLLDKVYKKKKELNISTGDKIVVNCSKNKCCYFLGNYGSGRGKYVTKEKMDYARQIMQNEYYEKVEKKLAKIIRNLERSINSCDVLSITDVYAKMSKGRQCMVEPIIETDEEYIARWLEEHPGSQNGYPIAKPYDTNGGEVVRTKAEKIIADELYRMGIPYRYEPKLQLDNGLVKYPDFVALNVNERKTYWIEHFGLTNDSEYIQDNLEKLIIYERNGIVIGDNLIVTVETANYPQNVKTLDKKIKKYLK